MVLSKEIVAMFEKTTSKYALFRHSPGDQGEDYIVQVYVPLKQLNGSFPQSVKVTVQQL